MHFSIINFEVDLSVNFVPCVIMPTSELLCTTVDMDEKMGFGAEKLAITCQSSVQPKIMCSDCSVKVRGFLQNARSLDLAGESSKRIF